MCCPPKESGHGREVTRGVGMSASITCSGIGSWMRLEDGQEDINCWRYAERPECKRRRRRMMTWLVCVFWAAFRKWGKSLPA